MSHIPFKQQAESLIDIGWGVEGDSVESAVSKASGERLMVCLLIDIATSLRALRCSNFVGMPGELRRVARSTEGIRRDLKARKARR